MSTCGRIFEPLLAEKAEKVGQESHRASMSDKRTFQESGNFLNMLKEIKSKEISGESGGSGRSNKKDRSKKGNCTPTFKI